MSVDHFSTATALLSALRAKEVSAVELARMYIQRIEDLDGALNAIPVRTFDRALAQAAAADAQLAAGEAAPLLGLPMTLKESCMVEGLPQTAGIEAFKGYVPAADGDLPSRTFNAGAGLLGKTNIPVALGDWQADSPVYGRTNNPWDLSRTPGGSTGGGGAALAAGLTPLELGSDIGGSIRVPAAYCGVWGHRPTETVIPRSGAFPMADAPNALFLMAVQGPLARSAVDLELYFDVLAGPEVGEDAGWRLDLPSSRAETLDGFRIGVVREIGEIRPSSQMLGRLDALAGFLSDCGAHVEEVNLPFDPMPFMQEYVKLLVVLTSLGQPEEDRQAAAAEMRSQGDWQSLAMADGMTLSASDYVMLGAGREFYRAAWRDFFTGYDVVITPTALDAPFPHQDAPQGQRVLTVDNEEVNYFNNVFFPSLAIFTGQPATAFPAGLDSNGLPLGLQAIGPYLEDRTTLRFAQLLESEWQGFVAPPGY